MKTKKKIDKLKTFRVTEEAHDVVMQYCDENSLKANDFVGKLLIKTIRNLNERSKSPE